MITVAILINGQPLTARSATRVPERSTGDAAVYKCDDGTIIEHDREEGAIALAHAMLNTIDVGKIV